MARPRSSYSLPAAARTAQTRGSGLAMLKPAVRDARTANMDGPRGDNFGAVSARVVPERVSCLRFPGNFDGAQETFAGRRCEPCKAYDFLNVSYEVLVVLFHGEEVAGKSSQFDQGNLTVMP